ncbi:MAG TPA: hypothetical protein VGM25_09815 [Caulobacteraceae bacterium]
MKRLALLPVVGVFALSLGPVALAAAKPAAPAFHSTRASAPFPDCQARVAYDRDMVLPGYLLPTKAGPKTCIPFTTPLFKPPPAYKGDYYVDEFTDEKLRAAWHSCEADPVCKKRVFDQVMARHPPNKETKMTDPHGRFLLGKIDEKGAATDLKTIRRPAYFARAPYNEPIAADDASTYIVEFTAGPEPYERLHEHMTADIKIRGWYIRGQGIDDGHGHKVRALVTMSGGGGDRVTAIDDPKDRGYEIDPKTGLTIPNDDFPNQTTGVKGMAAWRKVAHTLHEAGYDVLEFDRRGVGISGGYSDTNTLQQGRDLLDIVAALRSGKGVRVLTPTGQEVQGKAAAETLHGPAPEQGLPVLFMGSSRGTMASSWAMTINFDKECSYDLPKIVCTAPRKDPHVKGAILVADFSSGVGYVPAETTPKDDGRGPGRDRALFIGGIEVAHNIVFFPSSATLAGMHKWPSAFFARGLWCYADGLEGEMDSYSRIQSDLKDLVVVRGPHAFETWPASEQDRVKERMIAYADAVVLSKTTVPGRRAWTDMKSLVATSGDVWEPSTQPTTQK